jgi:hypothetical protein
MKTRHKARKEPILPEKRASELEISAEGAIDGNLSKHIALADVNDSE